MSTNYYAIPKATDELKEQIINLVKEGDFITARKLMPDEIHIGKSSAGWQFCFDHNNWKYFNHNKASLEVFLLSCDITDEYGRDVSNKDFWELVESKKHLKADGDRLFVEGLVFANYTNFC